MTELVLPGSFVALVGGTLALFLKYGRQLLNDQSRRIQQQTRRIEFLDADSRWCNDRVSQLMRIVRTHDIEVPDALLERPSWLTELDRRAFE